MKTYSSRSPKWEERVSGDDFHGFAASRRQRGRVARAHTSAFSGLVTKWTTVQLRASIYLAQPQYLRFGGPLKNRVTVLVSACWLSLILLLMVGCGQGFLSGTSSSSSATGGTGTGLPVPVGPSGGGGGGGGASGNEFLYTIEFATSPQLGWVEGFGINRSTGALHMVSKVGLTSDRPQDIKIDTQSQYLFAVSSPGCCTQPPPPSTIQSLAISAGGNLGFVASTTSINNQTNLVNSLLLDAAGRNLYAAEENLISTNGSTSEFTVNRATGQMLPLGPTPNVDNEFAPGWLVMSPNGLFVYASIRPRHLAVTPGGWFVMTRDPATGALTDTFKSGSSTATVYPGPGFEEIYNSGVFVLGGRYLVGATSDSKKVTVWSADAATGALKPVTEIDADFGSTVTADQSGNFVFVTHQTGVLNSYRVNADGTLTLTGSASAGAGASGVLENSQVSPDNHFVYVTDGSTAQIWGFTFNATTGALGMVPGSPFAASNAPSRMAAATK